MELLHRNYHGFGDVGVNFVAQAGVREDHLHDVKSMDLIVITLVSLLELTQKEVQRPVQKQSLLLFLDSDLSLHVVGTVRLDDGWLGFENCHDSRWDAG